MPDKDDENITRNDLENTLETHRRAIELQILISQNLEKILDRHEAVCKSLDELEDRIEKVEAQFTNGFKKELKEHVEAQITQLEEEYLKALKEALEVIERRTWKQWWLWGGIVFFTIGTAISTVLGLVL